MNFNLARDESKVDGLNESTSQIDTLSLDANQPPRVAPVRTKLHVSNFPENCTRRMLTEFFSKFGVVLECAIMWDKYAFIHYGTMAEAQNALKQASHMYFMGNRLSIKLSTSRNRQSCDWYQHEAAKLAMKLQQGDLESADSDSAGNFVETKLYVTNLPENCNQVELSNLFAQYGIVLECVIMWNHYAFVHFQNLREAKIALSHLNGYNYNGKMLVVQLSSSSNRPLPKCLAFENRKNQQSTTDGSYHQRGGPMRSSSSRSSNCSNKYDQVNQAKTMPPRCQVSAESSSSSAPTAPKKDWIELLKSGSLNLIMNQPAWETVNNKDKVNPRQDSVLTSQVRTSKPEAQHFGGFDVKKLFSNPIFEEDEQEKGDTINEFANEKEDDDDDDDDEFDNCNSSADIDSDLCSLNDAWSSHRNPSQRNEALGGSPLSVCSSKSSVSSAECPWVGSMGCLTLDQIPTPPLPSADSPVLTATEKPKILDMWPTRASSEPQLDLAFSRLHLDSAELLPFTIPLKSLSVNYAATTTSSESLSSGSIRPSSISTTGSSHHSPSNLSDTNYYSSDSLLLSSGNFEETIMNPCSSAHLASTQLEQPDQSSLFMNHLIESTKGRQLTSTLDQLSSKPQLFEPNQPADQQRAQPVGQKLKLTRCKAINYILFPELKNAN